MSETNESPHQESTMDQTGESVTTPAVAAAMSPRAEPAPSDGADRAAQQAQSTGRRSDLLRYLRVKRGA